jgi:hypothetical protein
MHYSVDSTYNVHCTSSYRSLYFNLNINMHIIQQSVLTPFLVHQSFLYTRQKRELFLLNRTKQFCKNKLFFSFTVSPVICITLSGEPLYVRVYELTKSTTNYRTEYIARIMHQLWSGQCTDYGPDSAPIMNRTVHRLWTRECTDYRHTVHSP